MHWVMDSCYLVNLNIFSSVCREIQEEGEASHLSFNPRDSQILYCISNKSKA